MQEDQKQKALRQHRGRSTAGTPSMWVWACGAASRSNFELHMQFSGERHARSPSDRTNRLGGGGLFEPRRAWPSSSLTKTSVWADMTRMKSSGL